MNVGQYGAIIALLGASVTTLASPLAESRMDADAEGWVALNGARDFHWVSDGYIQASDVNGSELWFFAAPAAYRGDIRSALGGALSFSLMTTSNAFSVSRVIASCPSATASTASWRTAAEICGGS